MKLLGCLVALALVGCSKDNQSPGGAATPTSGGPPAAANGNGPLANLESSPSVAETWSPQEGGPPMQFLFYGQQNVRLSASCRQPSGQLQCAAIQQLRHGMPVEIPRRSLTGGLSAGTHACMKLNHQLVTGRNSVGSEDGFCRFPDGSMISTGALEQYGMRVIQ